MIAGDEVTLSHEAFSSMALVMHELVTNAVKYGSLNTNRGKVIIDTRLSEDGNLCINWRELDGPLVEKPTRRGFGSTVIERTIPFELGGTASMSFEPSGLVAELTVPSRYIGEAAVEIEPPRNETKMTDESRPEIIGNVLVLEDNMIIALDLADTMKAYATGEIFVASNVADAMIMIEKTEFGLAILDVNLGNQTSLQVAETLFERNVPFMLATGFGETGAIVAAYPKGPIIKKPYVTETLEQALRELIS
jgi:CheY-like chemotaxis protein